MQDVDFQDAKADFIAQWGTLGSSWGINRTMAQIHALLMMSPDPLPTNEIMETLKVSRGNANTNLRDLVGWGLVRRATYPGDRKEYFEAEKDVWTMFCTIARERKRREIEPAMKLLQSSAERSYNQKDPEQKLFAEQTQSLSEFMNTADQILSRIARSEESKILPFLIKKFKLK